MHGGPFKELLTIILAFTSIVITLEVISQTAPIPEISGICTSGVSALSPCLSVQTSTHWTRITLESHKQPLRLLDEANALENKQNCILCV